MGKIDLKQTLEYLYGAEALDAQTARYDEAVRKFEKLFAAECKNCASAGPHIFRAPGRTEIGGNHTDHQNGQVLVAAIDMDIIAAAAVSEDDLIKVNSEGFGTIKIDIAKAADEAAPERQAVQEGTTESLIFGMASEMRKHGYKTGGFRAYVTSNLPEGAGISSSAAFEMLMGTILNGLFNEGKVPPEEIALMAQTTENIYYGKPSGLMDQMASAMGGICRMDFCDPAHPEVEKLDVDFSGMGYCVCITNTHGSHANFTEDYAAVQTEMAMAAGVFGQDVMNGITPDEVIANSSEIREAGGDRAFLRAMHVTAENRRVARQADALKKKDMHVFLDLVRRSGDSSYKLLQNVHVARRPERQELAVALAISEAVLEKAGRESACRVHGGGFAGTIQAFVPKECAEEYRTAMDEAFGEGSCLVIRICPEGAVQLL